MQPKRLIRQDVLLQQLFPGGSDSVYRSLRWSKDTKMAQRHKRAEPKPSRNSI